MSSSEVDYTDLRDGVELAFFLSGSTFDPTRYDTPGWTNFSDWMFTPKTISPEFTDGFHGNRQTIWKRRNIIVNDTHIFVSIPKLGDYNTNGDEEIHFVLESEAIMAKAKSVEPVTIKINGPEQKVDGTTKAVAEIAVGAASTVGAVASASGVVAAQAARSKALMALSACYFEYGEPLGFLESPTAVAITSDKTRFYLGAAVMNPVLLVLFTLLHLAAAKAYSIGSDISFTRGMTSVYMPNLLFIPLMLFMQDTITAATTVILHAETKAPKVVASVTFAFWAAVWGVIFYIVWKLNAVFVVAADVHAIVDSEAERKRRMTLLGRAKTRFFWFFLGYGDWMDATSAR